MISTTYIINLFIFKKIQNIQILETVSDQKKNELTLFSVTAMKSVTILFKKMVHTIR